MANLQKEKPKAPSITIVIGTLNRPQVIIQLLRQIQAQKLAFPIEVLVFDQSDQKNYQLLKKAFPKESYYYLHHLDKPNTCHYLNLGWQKANAPIVLYLDDDVVLTDDTISVHLKTYINPSVMGVAGRVINKNETISKSSLIGKIQSFGALFHKNFSSVLNKTVDFPYGCNMSFRKKTLQEINGFDEKLQPPIYAFNEIDLAIRLNKKWPKSLYFQPLALVHHQQYPSGGTRFYNEKQVNESTAFNYGYFIGKNFNCFQNILWFFRRLPFQLLKEPDKILSIVKGFIAGKRQTFRKSTLLMICLFGLIGFLRFYKTTALFNFTFSEENQAHMAWEQVKNFHPIWIGVSAANINYYLGPGYTYLNYILFLFSKGDPIILAHFSSFLGLITSISVFYVVRTIINNKTAVFSTLIYGCSTLINFHDRRFWNATPIPFITIWMIFSLVQAKKNTRWYILTAILIGAFYHTHLSLLLLFVPTLYSVIINFKKIKISTWILMVACYLLITSPLLVFDFVHNFDNLLMPFRTLLGKQKVDLNHFSFDNITSHLQELQSTLGRLWFITINSNPQDQIVLESHYGKTTGSIVLSAISLISLIYFSVRYRQKGYQILSISLLVNLLAFIIYPSYNPEYYLMSFLVLMTIAIGYWLSNLPIRLAIFITIFFIVVNTISTITMSDKYGLFEKKQLINKTVTVLKDQPFRLETYGELPNPHFAYAGWRYLFKVYGKTPASSNIDQVLGYLYQDELNKVIPKLKVIVVDTIKPSFTDKPLIIINQGVYSAYVFKNQ